MTTKITGLRLPGTMFTLPKAASPPSTKVYLGSAGITTFYQGVNSITKIYLGSTEIV
jgi:hypothetical protein